MKVAVYYGKRFEHYTTTEEILNTYNKDRAKEIVNTLMNCSFCVRPVKGTTGSITYKLVK